jgi:predicted CoA-binding protein
MSGNPLAEWPKLQPWAVVGASQDREKYGNIIYRDLKAAGYKVYPVNPKLTEVEGDPCYPDIASLPEKPQVVDLVVPPKAALQVVEDCHKAGIQRIWFQPGSESDEALEKAEAYGIEVIANACIMLEKVTV